MADPLYEIALNSPGSLGVNKERQYALLDSEWATDARNAVIDEANRIVSRNGWVSTITDGSLSSSDIVKSFFEYIDGSGTTFYILAAANKLFSINLSTGASSDITGTLTPTADNWKFQNFNDKVVGFQESHSPIVWDGTGSFTAIVATSGSVPGANEVLSAYGRLWTIEGSIVKYSDLLIETAWDSGSAGTIDLDTVWTKGEDTGVALAAFNGYLIIFGKNNILIYASPENPFDMQLVESINGVGCIARDSIQILGTDIWFLHSSGLQSFGRVIQEKSLPSKELSVNVRSYIQKFVQTENVDNIKSIYVPEQNFYLLSFPSSSTVFCFDTRNIETPTGGKRVTTWLIDIFSFLRTSTGSLYLGLKGFLGLYSGLSDNNSAFSFHYTSGWFSAPQELQGREIIFKNARGIFITEGDTALTFGWEFDFGLSPQSVLLNLDGGEIAEYGEAEYGNSVYGGAIQLSIKNFATQGRGQYILISCSANINGNRFGIHKIDLKFKPGKLA